MVTPKFNLRQKFNSLFVLKVLFDTSNFVFAPKTKSVSLKRYNKRKCKFALSFVERYKKLTVAIIQIFNSTNIVNLYDKCTVKYKLIQNIAN